jgi:hypothetical protein
MGADQELSALRLDVYVGGDDGRGHLALFAHFLG